MRPLIESSASMTRPSWRRGVGGTHWLKQAKTTIRSGMGGGSWCVERIGQSRFYTGFSRSASSPVLAKVLLDMLGFNKNLHNFLSQYRSVGTEIFFCLLLCLQLIRHEIIIGFLLFLSCGSAWADDTSRTPFSVRLSDLSDWVDAREHGARCNGSADD